MHEQNLTELKRLGDPARALQMQAYHKVDRPYLGLANPQIDTLVRNWRKHSDSVQQVAIADGLWRTDIYEARLAAAKLLTQTRIQPDDEPAWQLIASWTLAFDSWAIADHACMAGQRRLLADPRRLDRVETWIESDHMWSRRAALVSTLPWTRQINPTAADLAIRDRVLGWAAKLMPDHEWFIQKAIGWWLRELSKRDEARTRAFIEAHGARMKSFAVREALRHLDRS